MKNKKTIVVFLGFSLAGFLVYLNFKTPFFNVQNYNEVNHSLFGKIDPLLGYAHNENYLPKSTDKDFEIAFDNPAYTHHQNGFVSLSYKTSSDAKKIIILGSSTSDPYMYNGNWPMKFHEILKDMNIPHIIYNGSVSGYNSSQVVTKLIRDALLFEKIDLIITYMGGNDFLGNVDVIENHPSIHPYQQKILENVKVYSNKDLSNWNKIKSFFNGFYKKSNSHIVLGVKNSNYSSHLIKNIKYIKAICDVNKVNYIHVVEGVISKESQRITDSVLSNKNLLLERNLKFFLNTVASNLVNEKYVYSIQENIPKDEKLFYDSVHMSDKGNKILAEEIYSVTKRFLNQ